MPADDLIFQYSTFSNKQDNKPRYWGIPWQRMVESFMRHAERTEKDGKLWSPTIYKGTASRGNSGVEGVTAAVGDFDSGISLGDIEQALIDYEYVAHSTHSHTTDHPKFRVIIPFSKPVSAKDWPELKTRIDEHVFKGVNDPGGKDQARMYYTPSCLPGAPRFAQYHQGKPLDPCTLPGNTRGASPTKATTNKKAGDKRDMKVMLGRAALEFVAGGAPQGEQRIRALATARNYLSAGHTIEETADAVWRGLKVSPQDPDKGEWQYEEALAIATDLSTSDGPPLDISPMVMPPPCHIERVGLGYVLRFPTEGIELTIDHLRRGRDGPTGEILVEAAIAGLPRHLHWARLNMASSTARSSLEKILDHRTQGALVRWDGILETLCREVAIAERQGEPFEDVGDLTTTYAGQWLIRNLAVVGEPTTIFGEGATGKSNFVLANGLSVQTGRTFVPGFPPLRQGNVLTLDWETSRDRIDSRIKALCTGVGLGGTRIRYRRCVAGLADQIEEVLRECQVNNIVLVIIDSVEMAITDARENNDANDAIKRLYTALRYLNTTCLLVDHVSAASTKEKGARKPYGGIFKLNLCRLAFDLRKGQEGEGKIHLGLYNTKRNDDGTLLSPIGLRAEFGMGASRYYQEEITDPELVSGLKGPDRVNQALRDGPMTVADLAEATGETANNVYRICHRGKAAGTYRQMGKLWELAEKF